MAFEFKSLEEKQYLSDMTKEVNRIGNYLKDEMGKESIETINQPDFKDILKHINKTGNYYVTTSLNQPKGESWNGYVFFEKRNDNYYKIYFNPFNNENIYLRTYNNGTLTDWQRFILDEETNKWQKYQITNEQGQYSTQEGVDIKDINSSKTVYVKDLIDPPKPELNEGWLDTKVHEDGDTAITTFNPINSTTTYTKMQKKSREQQNPNLLRDSLFNNQVQYYQQETKDKEWSSQSQNNSYGINFYTGVKYEGQNTISIKESDNITHSLVRSNYLEVGKDVEPGDKVTFSTYVMIENINTENDNWVYIQICKYDDISSGSNIQVGSSITINGKDAVEVVKPNEWVRVTNTQTVPSDAKYITANIRANLSRSDKTYDWKAYFALPKLEKGDKATPFITHEDDKFQFDEIYTNWLENPDEQSVLNNYVSDINNDNYFKYTFWRDEVGDMTLQDLFETLPQGYHTFYAQKGIKGVPKDKSIRGVVQIDNDEGDITKERKFISAQFTDYDALSYNLYYDSNRFSSAESQSGWSPLRQTEQATYLWDGEFDLGSEGSTITLEDDYRNYEYLDILFLTAAAGHEKTVRIRTNGSNFYIRDFNLYNDSTSPNLDVFEGYFTIPNDDPKKPVAKMMKVIYAKDNKVGRFNETGSGIIKRITGINTI